MTSTLRIVVVASPETNDHEVQCLVDGVDIIEQLDGIGLDPDDFFSPPMAIAAGSLREARIGRCDCGVVGCGDITVGIVRDGEHVIWSTRTREVWFEVAQYERELARSSKDFTWETPERTAARLLRERVPPDQLASQGLVFEWASGRVRPGQFTISLHPTQGEYRQILVDVPWMDDLELLLTAAVEALRRRS